MQLSKATLKRVSSRPAWALPGLCWSRVRALRGIPPLDGAVPSETGALERERALKASVARRSIAALRVSEGAEAFLRPAAFGSACAPCSVCAVGPLPWCCFLRRPLLHLRSLRSLVRRCEKMSIRLLTGPELRRRPARSAKNSVVTKRRIGGVLQVLCAGLGQGLGNESLLANVTCKFRSTEPADLQVATESGRVETHPP